MMKSVIMFLLAFSFTFLDASAEDKFQIFKQDSSVSTVGDSNKPCCTPKKKCLKDRKNSRERRLPRQKRERRCDQFIDKDGDGINDNRCKGMGFCKRKKRNRKK